MLVQYQRVAVLKGVFISTVDYQNRVRVSDAVSTKTDVARWFIFLLRCRASNTDKLTEAVAGQLHDGGNNLRWTTL